MNALLRPILFSALITLALACSDDRRRGTGSGEGGPCPCVTGLICDPASNLCIRSGTDAGTVTDSGTTDAGGTTDSGTTTGGANCEGMCARAGSSGCSNFDMTTCVSDCRSGETDSATAGCAPEYDALIDCGVTATYTCDGSREPATADCEEQANVWLACLSGGA